MSVLRDATQDNMDRQRSRPAMMSTDSNAPVHPGVYIRERVIPSGVTVTEAAERLGVGRPALSRMLNGKSSLSRQMAVRLEKTFGADSQKLLNMQAAFERHEHVGQEKSIAVRTYVPSFLSIKARQFEEWPNGNRDARYLLPVLLRRLVHTTGQQLSEVDFPGYDNAERKGSDGRTVSGTATAWIPHGTAHWEFSVERKPAPKAETDYRKRTRSVPPSERQESTFVFVTPRNWLGKDDWVRRKLKAGEWKAVRAYDASSLEQWLEESILVQTWFAEQLGLPTRGIRTLDECWDSWSKGSEPKLKPAIFDASVATHGERLQKWLQSEPRKPFSVTAGSKEEALAFIACVFRFDGIGLRRGDRAAVFESEDALRQLAVSSPRFIPIVTNEKTERALAGMYRERHCIVVRRRSAFQSEPDIALERPEHGNFVEALATMGFDRAEADGLARASGRSLTVLRRRLSRIEAIRTPVWARDAAIARSLIPMALIGDWNSDSDADREILSLLARKSNEEIDKEFQELLIVNDAPVWASGQFRGVVSKIDALFAVRERVTAQELGDFLFLAEMVLSESDPALELPEDRRWAASVYGKVRKHSAALRKSVCETLVILAVHSDNLFRDRLGVSVEARVSGLIERLLTPLSFEKLLSHKDDLPRYAEAAPDLFLRLIEEDLKQSDPVVPGLLAPAGDGVFGSPLRTEVIWALECLAWKHLARVVPILARLSRIEIEDNWVISPINSLVAIYRSWMPQTAASLEERVDSLKALARKFPDVGWKVCMDQLTDGPQLGMDSNRPRWRRDASGAGKVVETWDEVREFVRKVLEIVLAWPDHDGKTLQDLVERIHLLPDDAQEKVWETIDDWANSETDEAARAKLAEGIRRFALTRRGKKRRLDEAITHRARETCDKLRSSDPVIRHAWLFANGWIELSAEDTDDDDLAGAYLRREQKIERLRTDAMREVWQRRKFEGVVALLEGGAARYLTGSFMARVAGGARERADVLRDCLAVNGDLELQMDSFVQGFLGGLDNNVRGQVISDAVDSANIEQTVRVLRCAPFVEDTWRRVDELGEEVVARYWKEVIPHPGTFNKKELVEIIDRLLEAKRPRAAFIAAQYDWSRVDTARLKRLLRDVANVHREPSEAHRLDPYHISKALDALDGRAGVTVYEMATLEFSYISFLDHREYRISNLERQMERKPLMFVQLLALMRIKRNDGGEDPAHWKAKDSEREWFASTAYGIFREMKSMPGTQPDGEIDEKILLEWIVETRKLCSEHGRAEMGDHHIGQLLSRAGADESGVWPCRAVCEAMETVGSSEVGRGFAMGVLNSRGAQWRDKGGRQERELAAKYRRWADELKFEFPFVGSVLENIAADYGREAAWQDDRAEIEDRLLH